MIEVKVYICEHCGAKTFNKDECIFHEDEACELNTDIEWKTYKFKKCGRGFADLYYTCVTTSFLDEYDVTEEDLCQMIGERTKGGEQSGWKVEIKEVKDGVFSYIDFFCKKINVMNDVNFY